MEQVRRRDSKFKCAIAASIVLGMVGAISFFMVNATNKLSDIGKDAANTISQNGAKPANDNIVKDPSLLPVSNEQENLQPVNNSAGSLSLHENSS